MLPISNRGHCELLHISNFLTFSTGTYEVIGLVMCPTMFSINKDSPDVKKNNLYKNLFIQKGRSEKAKAKKKAGARRVVPLHII